MTLVLCKFSDHALNVYQVSWKYLERPQSYEVNTISKVKNTKGNNSAKLQMKKWLLFSAYHLFKDYESFFNSSKF